MFHTPPDCTVTVPALSTESAIKARESVSVAAFSIRTWAAATDPGVASPGAGVFDEEIVVSRL